MPVLADFSLCRLEDGYLTIGLNPPVSIGGWEIQLTVKKRFGGVVPLITRSVASGFNTVSGIEILDSGSARMRARIDSFDTSGWDYGNYAFTIDRLTSGFSTCLTEGYFMVMPR